jgi:hypothetical protein
MIAQLPTTYTLTCDLCPNSIGPAAAPRDAYAAAHREGWHFPITPTDAGTKRRAICPRCLLAYLTTAADIDSVYTQLEEPSAHERHAGSDPVETA